MRTAGPRRQWKARLRLLLAACLFWPAPSFASAGDVILPYQLDVEVNGEAKNVLVGFDERGPGRFVARRADLVGLGLAVPGTGKGDDLVDPSSIPGVTYIYDEAGQRMRLKVPAHGFRPRTYDAVERAESIPPPTSGTGLVLDHSLVLSTEGLLGDRSESLTLGFAGNMRATLFTERGAGAMGVIAGSGLSNGAPAIRLDTSWTDVDDSALVEYRYGDAISGALSWSRPIRFAGIQLQRNFGLRPDYVVAPLPVVTGSAALPSTVDLYLDGVRAYSRNVEPGPFTITNVPIMSGGLARIVVRDASGRVTESVLPVYASAALLREGLVDFSVEGGVPRRNFGTLSFDYELQPVASGSLRYGLSSRLTLEGHAEAGLGTMAVGIGAAVAAAEKTVVNVAASSSSFGGSDAAKLFAGIQTRWQGLTLSARTERMFGRYVDLATASTSIRDEPRREATLLLKGVARTVDVVSAAFPVPFVDGSVSLSLIRAVSAGDETRMNLGATYMRPIDRQTSLYISASHELDDGSSIVFLGLSRILGENTTGSASLGFDRLGASATVDVGRAAGQSVGDYGWRATVTRGAAQRVAASGSYRTSMADVDAYAVATDRQTLVNASASGSVILFGGDVRAVNAVTGSFAVVDVGAPDIPVSVNNRPSGKTGSDGRAFVTGLLPYNVNRVSIDTTNLPPDTEASVNVREITPRQASGVVIDMKVKPAQPSGLVQFVLPEGEPVPVGAVGTLDRSDQEPFVVGYDGRAFIARLAERNVAKISFGEKNCSAPFTFSQRPGEQVQIDAVICR